MVKYNDPFFIDYVFLTNNNVKEDFSCFNYVKEDGFGSMAKSIGRGLKKGAKAGGRAAKTGARSGADAAKAAAKKAMDSAKAAAKKGAGAAGSAVKKGAGAAGGAAGKWAKKNPGKAIGVATVGGVMGAGGIIAAVDPDKNFADGVSDAMGGLGDAATIVMEPLAVTGGIMLKETASVAGDLGGGMLGGMGLGNLFGGDMLKNIAMAIIAFIIFTKVM